MEDISYLQNRLKWKKNDLLEYEIFRNDENNLRDVKHFVSNNTGYYYTIDNDQIIVFKYAR